MKISKVDIWLKYQTRSYGSSESEPWCFNKESASRIIIIAWIYEVSFFFAILNDE